MNQCITLQSIGSQTNHDCLGIKERHNIFQDSIQYLPQMGVLQLWGQFEVQIVSHTGCAMMTPFGGGSTGGGEKARCTSMKGYGEYQVCFVKGRLDPIGVMNVQIKVQDTPLLLSWLGANWNFMLAAGFLEQQFLNSKHDIIDITKSTCFGWMSMMSPPTPMNGHLNLIGTQKSSSREGRSTHATNVFMQ
jgi:hypothetical protein